MKAGWTEVALGDVATIDRRSVTAAAIASGTLYVGLEDIDAGGGEVRPRSVEAGELGSNKFLYDSQHILYGKLRPYLAKIACAPGAGICSTDILPIRPSGVDKAYLLHFLRQPAMVDRAAARSSGANLPRLAAKELERFQIPLPPLAEQKRIAAILDKADELQAKRRAAITHLHSLTQAIFLDMFGDPVTNPMGWRTAELEDALSSIDSGRSPVCLDRIASADEWAILKLGAVSTGTFNPAANKALREGVRPDARLEVRDGDVLIARKNTPALVGSCVVAHEPPPRLLLPDLIFRLVCVADGPLLPMVLSETLRSPRFKGLVQGLATGAAASMVNISKEKFRSLRVPIPPFDAQSAFLYREARIRSVISAANRAATQSRVATAALQSRAFRGEL